MVYFLTKLIVSDNTGVRLVQCIKILSGSNRLVAKPGDSLIVVVKRVDPLSQKITRGKVCRALLVYSTRWFKRCVGVWIRFGKNGVVLINNKSAPVAKRLRGPMLKEVCLRFNFIGTLTDHPI